MKYLDVALNIVSIVLNLYIIFYLVKQRKKSNESDE